MGVLRDFFSSLLGGQPPVGGGSRPPGYRIVQRSQPRWPARGGVRSGRATSARSRPDDRPCGALASLAGGLQLFGELSRPSPNTFLNSSDPSRPAFRQEGLYRQRHHATECEQDHDQQESATPRGGPLLRPAIAVSSSVALSLAVRLFLSHVAQPQWGGCLTPGTAVVPGASVGVSGRFLLSAAALARSAACHFPSHATQVQ